LFDVCSAFAFTLEAAKIVNMEELIVEEQNLICFYRLVPQAPISINNNNKLHHAMVGN
jgi:hypothetical protein